MRLFPDDDVPGLAAFAQEMPSPWLMPRGLSRRHRDRLGALVARAVHRFDPRIRCIQLRWAEAPHVREGRIRLPERALIWWRSDLIEERARDVLHEAPKIAPALHLLDLDGDPGVDAFGWLAPIKAVLAHRLTDALLEGPVATDPEPLIDAIDEAAARLVSPIDLLDFADRLIQTRAAASRMEDAQADAIALVLVERMAARPMDPGGAVVRAAALARAAQPGPLPPDVHALLLDAGLAEKDPAARSPLLDWASAPGVAARITFQLRLHPMVLQPVAPAGEAEARATTGEARAGEAEPSQKPRTVEDQAAVVLEAVRSGEERSWSVSRRRAAAATLDAFVGQSARSRSNQFVAPLYEREAAVLEVAARLWEDVAAPEKALEAWVGLAERCLRLSQVPRAQTATERARTFVERATNPGLRAWFFITAADISRWSSNFAEAEQGYHTALDLYRAAGYRIGEANALRSLGRLSLRFYRFAEAKQIYEAALHLCRSISDSIGEANTLRSLGELAMRVHDIAEAKQDYDAALRLYRAIGDPLGEANTLRDLGELGVRTTDLAEAKQNYDAALSVCRSAGYRLGEANTLWSLGDLALRTADRAEAKQSYDAALSLYRALGNRGGEANTLRSQGDLAVQTADLAGAKRAYDAARGLYHALDERVGEAEALRGLGLVELLEGREAAPMLRTSETLAAAAQDRYGSLLSRTFLAAVDPAPTAAGELDTLAASFSSLALPREASLARALARLRAGDSAAAGRLLGEQPETATIAGAVTRAAPDEAVRLLLPFIPTA